MSLIKRVIIVCLVGVTFISCKNKVVSNSVKEKPSQPNIIWLMAEDISTDLECYGMPDVKTPHLNKMAAEGIQFENAFVTNSICSPSRSAMMVGTHQIKTNSHNHRSNREVLLNKQFKPFTALLRDAGYTCILGHEKVFQEGQKIDVNFKTEKLGPWDGETKFGLFDKTNSFEKQDEPFFAQIQLKATHRGNWWNEVREKSKHPVNPETVTLPPYMADHPAIRLDWAKYLDQIEFIDDEVGMIFQELEDKGMADNTIVIFIGDNGRCNIRGKGYLHDPGLRIPFLIHYPKQFKGGEVRKDVVSATDITASILNFAGVEIPAFMTGKPIFKKGFKREYVYAARDLWDEIEEKSRALISEDWSYIRNDRPEIPYDAHQAYLEFYRPAVHVMRALYKEGKLNEQQKPFFEPTKPKEELYNLKTDPYQLKNLADDANYASILEKLRGETIKFDEEMKPVGTEYFPETPRSVVVLDWLKKERPVEYNRMKAGEEIGIDKMTKLYKEAQILKKEKK